MPRYFFHVIDGTAARDEDGTELPNVYVAQAEALRLSAEVLRDMGARFWDGTEWRLVVEGEGGQVLFVLRFSAEERLAPPDAGPDTGPDTGPAPDPAGG